MSEAALNVRLGAKTKEFQAKMKASLKTAMPGSIGNIVKLISAMSG